MGIRSSLTTTIVSILIMSIAWELSESGAIRNITGNFVGKVAVSFLIVLIANIIGSFLSGGK